MDHHVLLLYAFLAMLRAWPEYRRLNLFPQTVVRLFQSALQWCDPLGTDRAGGMSLRSSQKHSTSGNGSPVETRSRSDQADMLVHLEIAASARANVAEYT